MISYPLAIISDVHMNDWSQYSTINEDGLNTRLVETMDAVKEAALKLLNVGGKDLIVTGDLFHTRGRMKPSVFNPVINLFSGLAKEGIKIHILPGNHDLEGRDSDALGNATAAFSLIEGVRVYNEPTLVGNFAFIPWIESKEDFVLEIDSIPDPSNKVVFCHIGIDGVLDKVAGKVGKAVLDKGFKYVFSGDYHKHKYLGDGIYSVGALTHHSFADVNSIAGYLIVTEDEVKQFETKAAKFVTDPVSLDQIKGNYIRYTGEVTASFAKDMIDGAYLIGAKHVVDLTTRPSIKDDSKSTTKVKVDLGFKEALESFTKRRYGANHAEVLKEARAIIDDV